MEKIIITDVDLKETYEPITFRYITEYTEVQTIVRACMTLAEILGYIQGLGTIVHDTLNSVQLEVWTYFIKIAQRMKIDDFKEFHAFLSNRFPHLEDDFVTAFNLIAAENNRDPEEQQSHHREHKHCIVM